MSFYESPRFPNYLAYGLELGPMFASDVVRVSSGHESTNQRWSQALRVFDGSTTHRTPAQRTEIESFFKTMRGRTHRFRVKDLTDFLDDNAGIVTLVSGNIYQMYKRYTSGAQTYDREIRKPVDPVVITGGGSYTVDYTTGRVTHNSGNAPTGWIGAFDVPVRFDHDELKFEVATRSGGQIYYRATELRLVEVRV